VESETQRRTEETRSHPPIRRHGAARPPVRRRYAETRRHSASAARNPKVRRCPAVEGENAKTPRDAKTQEGHWRGSARPLPVIPRSEATACPERMRGKGSASTKALPAPGQIPPLAALAFGMTKWGGARVRDDEVGGRSRSG